MGVACLCVVYNICKVGSGPRPSASQNDSVLKSLKVTAKAWADAFDGNKLVIMTDHLYTPASMRSNAGATKFKGKDAALTSLLEAASEAGLDLEYNRGTVEFSKTGYAEMDYYTYSRYDRYCDGSSFSWGEKTDSTMSLH